VNDAPEPEDVLPFVALDVVVVFAICVLIVEVLAKLPPDLIDSDVIEPVVFVAIDAVALTVPFENVTIWLLT
jgi:hypothetical protein